jgi:GTPase SAR1 family protein
MNKSIIFIGPSSTGKTYLANLPIKDKLINEITVGIEYQVHYIGRTKYMILDTGDFNRYHYIIKDYLPKVNEIYLFANNKDDLNFCRSKLNGFSYKLVSDNIELEPDFLLSFTPNDIAFYKDEESPLLANYKKNKFFCCCK